MPPPINPTASAPPPGTKFILIALGLGFVAIIINVVWANSVAKSARETAYEVCLMGRSVSPNKDVLEKGDIIVMPIPEKFKQSYIDMGALTPAEAEAKDKEKAPFYKPVAQNNVLLRSAFDPKLSQDRVPAEGKAFKAIVVNDVRQPAGLHANSFVDIIGTFVEGNAPPRAIVVKEHVELVGIGAVTQDDSSAGRQPGHYRTVTIEIPVDERTKWIDIEHLALGQYFDIEERNANDQPKKEGITDEVLTLLNRSASSTPEAGPGRTVRPFRP